MEVDDDEALKRIAYNLRRLRGELSLAEIARRSDTYPAAIKRIEDGQNMPGVGLLTRIARALGVAIDEFLIPPKKSRKTG